MAQALWNAAAVGYPPAQLHRLRVGAARAHGHVPQSSSVPLRLAAWGISVLGDPACRHHREVVLAWATAVWTGSPPLDILQRALDSALNKLSVASRPWHLVNGPAAVYAMVLARLGWRAESARSVTVHTGVTLDLFSISPGAVSALANEATRRWSDVKATSSPAPGAPGFVIFWDALRPLLLG